MRTLRVTAVLRRSTGAPPCFAPGRPLVALAALAVLAVGAMAAPGQPDPSFGSAGKAVIDFGGSDGAWAIAAQPDRKIVLAGETSAGASPNDFAVVRLNENGSPDTSFGTGGKTTIDFGGDDRAFAVALQPDGKIVVAGQSGSTAMAVTRLNPDGSLDGSFGTGGTSRITFGAATSVATSVLVRPDGEIVVVGNTTVPLTQTDFTVVWLTPTGARRSVRR